MAAYAEGLNVLRHANVGAKAREVKITFAAWQARHVPESEQVPAGQA